MKKEITLTRTLDASRERVWQAWTDPAEVAQWWGPDGVTMPVCELDVRVGGTLNMVMHAGESLGSLAGQDWPMRGEFTEVVPLEKLAFKNTALDGEGNVQLSGQTSVVFEDEDGKTKITIITSAEGDGPAAEGMLSGMEQGWNQQSDKLVAFVGS